MKKTGIFTACLFASSFTLWLSRESARADGNAAAATRGSPRRSCWAPSSSSARAANTCGLYRRGIGVATNLFATTFFTLTGFHGLHVTVGLFALGDRPRARAPATSGGEPLDAARAVGLYWHFVDVVWLVVFTVVYLRAVR